VRLQQGGQPTRMCEWLDRGVLFFSSVVSLLILFLYIYIYEFIYVLFFYIHIYMSIYIYICRERSFGRIGNTTAWWFRTAVRSAIFTMATTPIQMWRSVFPFLFVFSLLSVFFPSFYSRFYFVYFVICPALFSFLLVCYCRRCKERDGLGVR
jgi:hypothetical protein